MASGFVSTIRFDHLPHVSDLTKRAIREVFGYDRLSAQQAKYMPAMVSPAAPDVFVKAGTGSGKTLGFLIPAIEVIISGKRQKQTQKKESVSVLILSPTRELANQTASEAGRLLTFHAGVSAQAITGGTDRNRDLRMIRTAPPSILVATPGRLQDLLDVEPAFLRGVRLVVLDEADRLLDPGFAPAVRKILTTVPSQRDRRTLLLTATVPAEVRQVAQRFMRPGFTFVDASGGTATNEGVRQVAVICKPSCVHIELARTLTAHHVGSVGSKVLVFFSSIALAELYAAIFRDHPRPAWTKLLELHGGLPQNRRTRAMDTFKREATGVLFASDAAGRGIDVPNVTMVVQVGCAAADVYQQRVGRTGRAGAKGEAVILLGSDEVRSLAPLRLISPSIQVLDAGSVTSAEHTSFLIGATQQQQTLAEKAFRGALGAYKANAKVLGWSSQDLVDAVAARMLGMGLKRLPEISEKTLGKMGLRGVSFDTGQIVRRMNMNSVTMMVRSFPRPSRVRTNVPSR